MDIQMGIQRDASPSASAARHGAARSSRFGCSAVCFHNPNEDAQQTRDVHRTARRKNTSGAARPPRCLPSCDLLAAFALLPQQQGEKGSENKEKAGEREGMVELEAALTACQDRKREGDRRFGLGDFEAAAEIYRDALNQLTAGEALAGGCWSETAKSARMLGVMKTILLQNCAACCHKLENFAEAIDLCTAALEFEPRAEQAVLQRARCLLAIGDDGAAYRDYMELAVAKPEALEPRRQMQAIEARNPGIAAVVGTMTPLPDVPHCGGLRESFLQSLLVSGRPMPSRHAFADGVGCRDLPAAHVG